MNIHQTIRALGGPTVVAERLGGITKQAVRKWCQSGEVPERWRSAIRALCIADCVPIPAEVES